MSNGNKLGIEPLAGELLVLDSIDNNIFKLQLMSWTAATGGLRRRHHCLWEDESRPDPDCVLRAVPMAAPAITFDLLAAEGSYAAAISNLRTVLASHLNPDVDGRPILAGQTGVNNEPPRWIHVVIHGPSGASPTVFVRDDNFYLVGFLNKARQCFELGKHGERKLLHGSTMLGFNGSYHSLIGGSSNIPGLALGKNQLFESAKALWNYGHAPEEDEEDTELMAKIGIKEHLARIVVALCEGARFPPVFDAVNASWDNQGGHIIAGSVTLINNWENLSSALIGTKLYGNTFTWPKNLIDVGIENKEEGLARIYLLLNKPPPRRLSFFVDYLKPLWHKLVRRFFGLVSSSDEGYLDA